jgi:hypothetical protein
MLSTPAQWQRLQEMGIEKWIAEKKSTGQIRQAGFSFHGTRDDFVKLIDCYPWEFCMIQYNYMNTNYQAGTSGLKYAHSKNIPVFIMEPLLGGKLATYPKKFVGADMSAVELALRWLWDKSEVTTVLSGMNADSHITENVTVAERATVGNMSESDFHVIDQIVDIFTRTYKIPCTGCNYCLPCPRGVNIPDCFAAYNASYSLGLFSGIQQYITTTSLASRSPASVTKCNSCGKCTSACPQEIAIPAKLRSVRKRLEPSIVRLIMPIVRKFMK